MENVKDIINKTNIDDFMIWINFLESIGYRNFYKKMNASEYGSSTKRERVFMVSSLEKDKEFIFPNKTIFKTVDRKSVV